MGGNGSRIIGSRVGEVVVSQPMPSLVPCHHPLRPSRQEVVCVGGRSIEDHTGFVLPLCFFLVPAHRFS